MRQARCPFVLTALLALALAATASAGFYQVPGRYVSGIVYANGSDAVELAGDGKVGVTEVLDAEHAGTLVVTFELATGRRISAVEVGGIGVDLRVVHVDGRERVAALTTTQLGLELVVLDLDRRGRLSLAARATLPPNSGGSLALSGPLGAGFTTVIVNGRLDLVAFSLESGLVLSQIQVNALSGPLVLAGETGTRLVFPSFDASNAGGFRVVDVGDPRHPIDVGFAAAPSDLSNIPLRFGAGLASLDGGTAFFADNEFGLWAVDVASARIAGRLADPSDIGNLAIHESGGRRVLAATTFNYLDGRQDRVVLVDATAPAAMTVVASRLPPPDYLDDIEFSPDGRQLYAVTASGPLGLDATTLEDLWTVPFPDVVPRSGRALVVRPSDGAVVGAWQGPDDPKGFVGFFAVPAISAVGVKKRDLVVTGTGFDGRCSVTLDGVAYVARKPGGSSNQLRVKRALDGRESGRHVAVRVRAESGTASATYDFVVP